MLGRGLLACPDLALQICAAQNKTVSGTMEWLAIVDLLAQFCIITEEIYEKKYVGNRVKQWLGYLRRQYDSAGVLFEQVKRLKWPEDIALAIAAHKTDCQK